MMILRQPAGTAALHHAPDPLKGGFHFRGVLPHLKKEGDEDLHRCCHNTLMNPVTARSCARPEDLKRSSAHVAQPSSVASSRTVPVRELVPHGPSDPHSGGGTPPEPAGGDACT